MKRMIAIWVLLMVVAAPAPRAQEPQYHMKAHIDEACSCKLFCPCYFNPNPDGDRCNFNNVFTVEKGNYGDVKLDGLKVWVSGNLAGELAKGFEGVIAAFEPTATDQQVDAFAKIAAKLYGLPMAKVVLSDRTAINVTHSPTKHVASRADDKGHLELSLPAGSAMDGKTAPIIRNLKYFGAPKNTGFKLFYGTHRYKGHGYDYSYAKHNGFTIDFEIGTPPDAKKTSTQ